MDHHADHFFMLKSIWEFAIGKAGAPKEFLLNKYCITDRMYNRVIDNEPEVIVKVKSYEFENSLKTSANINFSYFCSFVFF